MPRPHFGRIRSLPLPRMCGPMGDRGVIEALIEALRPSTYGGDRIANNAVSAQSASVGPIKR